MYDRDDMIYKNNEFGRNMYEHCFIVRCKYPQIIITS
jgi:hypothetical protein